MHSVACNAHNPYQLAWIHGLTPLSILASFSTPRKAASDGTSPGAPAAGVGDGDKVAG